MSRFKDQLGQALVNPGSEISRWTRFVRFQWELWRFCLRRLRENNLLAMSAALSFRTIFALIPLLVFALLVLKSIGVIEDSKQYVRHVLEVSGLTRIETATVELPVPFDLPTPQPIGPMPAPSGSANLDESPSGASVRRVYNVADEIESVLEDVESKLTFTRVGPIGGALLIWTALTLLMTMENSLNRIFGAPRSRAVGRRVVLYWSVLTLGPVVLVLASYVGEKTIDTFAAAPVVRWLLVPVGWFGPILAGILVIAAVYKLLPNTRVRARSAVGGALVAVPIWLVARWGFTLYVQHLAGTLYGVLGLLPLFLLWINLSWTIFLFGAQLAHTATNLERLKLAELAERIELGPSDVIAVAVVVARRFRAGGGPTPFDEICAGVNLPGDPAQQVVNRLVDAGFLCATGEHNGSEAAYTMAIPAERVSVAQLLEAGDPRAVEQIGATDDRLRTLLADVRAKSAASLGERNLAELIDTD